MSEPQWIKLTPVFVGDHFAGYDQVDDSHYFDIVDKQYEFVSKPAYDQLKAENEKLREALAKIVALDDAVKANPHDVGEEWEVNIEEARAALLAKYKGE